MFFIDKCKKVVFALRIGLCVYIGMVVKITISAEQTPSCAVLLAVSCNVLHAVTCKESL